MSSLCLRTLLLLVVAALAVVPPASASQVPQKMNYQVMLTNDADEPLADQAVELVFINSSAGGGSWADIRLQTNSVTRMFINQAGNVGIGTESPSVALDVVGTVQTEGLKMAGGATPGFVLTADGDGVGTWQAGGSGGADTDWSVLTMVHGCAIVPQGLLHEAMPRPAALSAPLALLREHLEESHHEHPLAPSERSRFRPQS